jgi:ribose transport system permease protein
MSTGTSVAIEDITGIRERSLVEALLANQAFWVSVAVALICLATAWEQPDTFATKANFFNVTRNFAAIGIMAMGMTAVIITGGIDLSVGSVMAFVGSSPHACSRPNTPGSSPMPPVSAPAPWSARSTG